MIKNFLSPKIEYKLVAERRGFVGGNAYAALRASTEKIGVVAKSQILVPREGIEPPTVSLRGSCSTS